MIPYHPMASLSLLVPIIAALTVFLVPTTSAASSPAKLTVLPLPAHATTGDTVICLSDDFTISIDADGPKAPSDLLQAMDRTERKIRKSRHKFLSVTGGQEFFKDSPPCDHWLSSLVLSFQDNASIFVQATKPVEHRLSSEAYSLSVPVSSTALAKADTTLGLLRALTTFEALFYHLPLGSTETNAEQAPFILSDASDSEQIPLSGLDVSQDSTADTNALDTGRVYAPFAPYEIEDRPSFGWRAVLLDTSRHYFGIDSIYKMLDTMTSVKLNVFHWHITDSNSWPLDLDAFPDLAAKGAYSSDEIYSSADVRSIVQYAGERGIDVVIEIDTPGHTAILAEAYPEHIACYDTRPWGNHALQPPSGQLRFADPTVADFTSSIFRETMDLTESPYFGTGGDEININCMIEDERTAAALVANGWTIDDALNDFTERTHATVLMGGKTPVVWQEMVLSHGPMRALNNNTIVDIWVNSRDVRAVLDKGYRIVHAAGDYFYLDCGQGGWIGTEGGGNSWCDPFKSWARMYSFDPFANVTEAQKKLVLGGQASVWAEQTDETNFETVLWPRAAAIAELFWTGAGNGGYPRSAIEALPRMHDTRYRMVDSGVRAVPIQPHWCALRPGVCVLGG